MKNHLARVALVSVTLVAAAVGFGIQTAAGFGSGSQVIQSGPGVYDQTTAEYASEWNWSQWSAPYDYYWYLFRSSGTLQASGHKSSGGDGGWQGAANVYYFKEYNNEPAGSGRTNVLNVEYCC